MSHSDEREREDTAGGTPSPTLLGFMLTYAIPMMHTHAGPAAGYPDNYPMLPFFGGYADLFWSNSMTPNPNGGAYFFGHGPSLRSEAAAIHGAPAAEANALGWTVPAGYPWVDVELGGGMAAAYNHRVHMDSSDMPAMHLCDVANGVRTRTMTRSHGWRKSNNEPPHTKKEKQMKTIHLI